MDEHTILQLIEIIFAVAGLSYGIFEHYKRQKIEKVLKTITQTFPGEVAKIEQSCKWAHTNFKDAHLVAVTISDSPEKNKLLKFLNQGTADAAASSRLCVTLFNHLLSFQQAQFNTRNIIHSEKDKLDLCMDEIRNSNWDTSPKMDILYPHYYFVLIEM